MKKALIVVAVLALVVWVVSWFWSGDAVRTSNARPWPNGLGTLEDAPRRFPPAAGNGAASKLTALGNALPEQEAVDEFVAREVARSEMAIGQPPSLPDVAAIRELLLRERVVWQRFEGFDAGPVIERRALHMRIARVLVASALAKARAGDATAWDDLHAAWNLARSQDAHPQMLARTSALTMARLVNAVSWKMPLPAPSWSEAVQQHDDVRALVEAFQYQAASYAADGAPLFPTKVLAGSVDRDRAIAEEMARNTKCEATPRANELGTDLSSVWRRAFRFRAEREATANAMRIRNGKPIETKSVCSDGTWSFDGTTLRFSREIPMEKERPMPLVLRMKP